MVPTGNDELGHVIAGGPRDRHVLTGQQQRDAVIGVSVDHELAAAQGKMVGGRRRPVLRHPLGERDTEETGDGVLSVPFRGKNIGSLLPE